MIKRKHTYKRFNHLKATSTATRQLRKMSFLGLELNVGRFKSMMKKLIGVTKDLQNNPADNLTPKETL